MRGVLRGMDDGRLKPQDEERRRLRMVHGDRAAAFFLFLVYRVYESSHGGGAERAWRSQRSISGPDGRRESGTTCVLCRLRDSLSSTGRWLRAAPKTETPPDKGIDSEYGVGRIRQLYVRNLGNKREQNGICDVMRVSS